MRWARELHLSLGCEAIAGLCSAQYPRSTRSVRVQDERGDAGLPTDSHPPGAARLREVAGVLEELGGTDSTAIAFP
uniref:Putative secreted protein n=1 Tax=Anopheles marajoara TaxID=58244 RepID=A0A2M4CDB3_9DIPT